MAPIYFHSITAVIPITSITNPSALSSTPPIAGDEDTRPRHEQGKENSHNVLDRKDEKTNANTIDEMKKEGQKAEQKDEARKAELKHDPTLAAREHGNEPSRGAKKDKELVDEEEEIIRKMDEAKAQSKEAHKH